MNPEQLWPNNNLSVARLNSMEFNHTPAIIIDKSSIIAQYSKLKESLPNIKIHYAVKCNPESEILKVLKNIGSSFEIASERELDRLIKIGVNPSDVIFSNTIKIPCHVKHTYKKGLRRFAYDTPDEIKKIAKYAPGAEVYLRVQVSNHGSVIPLASKFGASPHHATHLLGLAQDFGLKPIGLAFHVGSQAENIQLWDQAFSVIGPIYNEAKRQGIKLKMLNIGGGFPVRYAMEVPDVVKIGKHIKAYIKKHKLDELEIWAEPGRFLVGEAGVLVSTVIGLAARGNREWIYLDVGRFNGLAELFESDELRYPVISSKDTATNNRLSLREVTLTGPSCDSFDTIFHGVPLNPTVGIGDRVYFGTTGAYTNVYASDFNDFRKPIIKYV